MYAKARIACTGAALIACSVAARAGEAEFFEERVRPILAAHCYACHGPDAQKSDLRLDSAAAFAKGGSRGPVVDGSEPATSPLLAAIGYLGDVQMPPAGKLAQSDIDALTQWVISGAVWPDYGDADQGVGSGGEASFPDHWAYSPPRRVAVPDVNDESWPLGAIDRFILAEIEAAGERPSPPAEKSVWLRRATYGLIGLPPTPEELDAFLSDDAPDAYARVVDRLLASPRYGEHWARKWLDVVRYTDSFDSRGSPQTDPVEIWRYRDWVVRAFNEDMPYDEFVRYQIAGDLIPAAEGDFNRDGLIATGMLAIGNWPQGDADKEKMVTDIVDDQIDVVMRGMLGSTFTCARCHDHKFEPFTIEDYYGLAGVFFSSSILPGPGQKTEGSPILHLPLASPGELAARKARDERIAALNAEAEALVTEERAAWAAAESARTGEYLAAAWRKYRLGEADAGAGLNADVLANWGRALGIGGYPLLDRLSPDIHGMPGLHARNGASDAPSATANTTANEVKFVTITQPAASLMVHPAPDRAAVIGWRSPVEAVAAVNGALADADGNCGDGIRWSLQRVHRGSVEVLGEGAMANGGAAEFALASPVAVAPGDFLFLRIEPNAGHACDSTVVQLVIDADDGRVWNLVEDALPHFTPSNPLADGYGNGDVWMFLDDAPTINVEPAFIAAWWDAAETAALDAVASDFQNRIPEFAASLAGEGSPYWLAAPPPAPGTRRAEIEAELAYYAAHPFPPLDLAVGIQEGGVPTTPYEGFHDVPVHRRGDYTNLGAIVPRRLPVVLAGAEQPPLSEGSGRMALAEWVASPSNPLTARVMVNRMWQHHFGEGIVRTAGDFGLRGDAPTHPELLDHLALSFADSGWSVKAMHRAMLLSAAYRQSSAPSPGLLAADPENRLFARMNRSRLTAEALRDAMLAVSGRLDAAPGGPAFTDMNTPRRTLYLRTSRSDRTTYTTLFDGADPTAIVSKRTEATVAPQALFLLNHPFVINEAEALARRIDSEAIADDARRIDRLYRLLYGRPAREADIAKGRALLERLGQPAEGAFAGYCQVLLAANEFAFID